MPCINVKEYPKPTCLEHSGSLTKVAQIQRIKCFSDFKNKCSDLYNNNRCGNDTFFAQPIEDGDLIYIQTRFFDRYNKFGAGAKTCKYYLDLDKANKEHVVYGDHPSYHWGCADDVTFEMWFKLKSYSAGTFIDWSVLFAKQAVGAKEENYPALFSMVNSAGAIGVFFGMRRVVSVVDYYYGLSAPGAITLGTWHHWVWHRPANTYQAGKQICYLNGVPITITPVTETLGVGDCSLYQDPLNPLRTNDGEIVIGADYDCQVLRSSHFNGGQETMDGQVAGFRIYNRAVGAAEVAANYAKGLSNCPTDSITDPTDLVLNSLFNDDDGVFAYDASPLANHGKLLIENTWQIPNDSEVGCTPTTGRVFGYPAARTAAGGGAWINFTEDDFQCCPPDSPCYGVGDAECDFGEEFARYQFKILESAAYVFGAANQNAANVTDVGFILDLLGEINCSDFTFSNTFNQTRFSNVLTYPAYLASVLAYVTSIISTYGSSTVTVTPDGTFSILLDRAYFTGIGKDACRLSPRICQYTSPNCALSDWYTIGFQILNYTPETQYDYTLTCGAFTYTWTRQFHIAGSLAENWAWDINLVNTNPGIRAFGSGNILQLQFSPSAFPLLCECNGNFTLTSADPNFQV